jgi:toxin ParE1/3/4
MRVRYTRRARADLEAIHRFLHERSPRAAEHVMATLGERIADLARWPRKAPRTDEPGLHVLFIGRYPYKVFYEIEEASILVHHIRHTARRPWRTGV